MRNILQVIIHILLSPFYVTIVVLMGICMIIVGTFNYAFPESEDANNSYLEF